MGHFEFKRDLLRRPDVIYFPFSTLNFDSYLQPQISFKKEDHLVNLLYYPATEGVLFAGLVKRANWDTVSPPSLQANITNSWLETVKAKFFQPTHQGRGRGPRRAGPSLTSLPCGIRAMVSDVHLAHRNALSVDKEMSTKCFKSLKERHYESIIGA